MSRASRQYTHRHRLVFDGPGIIFSTTNLSLRAGEWTYYAICLRKRPQTDVLVDFRIEKCDRLSVLPTSVVFTPSNWNKPKRFYVFADAEISDSHATNAVICHSTSSSSLDYEGGLLIPPVHVVISHAQLAQALIPTNFVPQQPRKRIQNKRAKPGAEPSDAPDVPLLQLRMRHRRPVYVKSSC